MGEPYTPSGILPIGGIMYVPEVDLESIRQELRRHFHGDCIISAPFRVQKYTNYYDREMGRTIDKVFYYIRNLQAVENAYQWKQWSNRLEEKYVDNSGHRRVNLDPGYLTLSKLVLFSTKGYAHRIYIRDRIYAEVTLQYRHNQFHTLPWTYQDYATSTALEFWQQARGVLEQLIRTLPGTIPGEMT